MNIKSLTRTLPRVLPFTILCLGLSGCAAGASASPDVAPDRVAAASRICRDTMGLNPANAPYAGCVTSLAQNVPELPNPIRVSTRAQGFTGAQASCAQFGLNPDSDALAQCAADLDATLFEMTSPTPG